MPSQVAPPEQKLIAPLWHTIVLVLATLGVSAISYFLTLRLVSTGRMSEGTWLILKLPGLVVEWGLVAYVSWPMRRRGITIRKTINARWSSARAVWLDLGIALLVLAGLFAIVVLGSVVFRGNEAEAFERMAHMTPHTVPELCMSIAVAISSGFCEEFVFRGYLQEQCRRLTGNAAAGVVLQALLFGAAHGYQGWNMVTIFFGGLLLGATAAWRKSLAPTMIAHGAGDTVGAVGPFLEHLMRRI